MKTWNIMEYGARPDARTDNTSSIQRAINDCNTAGGGQVVCGPGRFVTSSIQLKTNVDLHLTAVS